MSTHCEKREILVIRKKERKTYIRIRYTAQQHFPCILGGNIKMAIYALDFLTAYAGVKESHPSLGQQCPWMDGLSTWFCPAT